jgi:primosomal protein N' (replication factor Y) (superfamily II helicase)
MTLATVSVAVPLPVQGPFDYTLPEGVARPPRGCRVTVPFGPRRLVGVVTDRRSGEPPAGPLKPVINVLETTPVVSESLLDLAEFVSDHYLAPIGECYRLVLPFHGLARRGASPGPREIRRAVLVDAEAKPRGAAQVRVLEKLKAAGGSLSVADLARDDASIRGAVQRLAEKGILRLEDERVMRGPAVLEGTSASGLVPTDEQAAAVRALQAATAQGEFRPFLLHGVTGSGKTEVYFRAAEHALAAGRGVLILVPEIALTPFLVRAAKARFGNSVAVLHSELSLGERYDQWWMIREGQSRVVVGARSAIFAPIAGLGLICVDEEHEGAYKQEENPRYHGRDLAVARAQIEKAVVVLGSATPSAESYDNALKGKYTKLALTTRAGSSGLPKVSIVDRRAAAKAGDDPVLTNPLRAALEKRLERKEQSLLLLNRRGFATSLLCRECGTQLACKNCSVLLAIHYGGARAVCHYCGFECATPDTCGACKGSYMKLSGYGTEQLAEMVARAYPEARVARLDRDAVRRRGELAKVLRAFELGETDILVGTQMIAKGHDFPKVTLVGVVDADVGLGLPDFRAAERTFQLLTQVAGRAGRADLPGEVVLQSHMPDHYALEFAVEQDYEGFFAREIEHRRTMGYPPRAALINLMFLSRKPEEGQEHAAFVARALRQRSNRQFMVLGPARAPLARLRQEHRFQILLKGSRAPMRDAVKKVLVERFGPQRWPGVTVDVDPINVM